jgi:hypothetical protein
VNHLALHKRTVAGVLSYLLAPIRMEKLEMHRATAEPSASGTTGLDTFELLVAALLCPGNDATPILHPFSAAHAGCTDHAGVKSHKGIVFGGSATRARAAQPTAGDLASQSKDPLRIEAALCAVRCVRNLIDNEGTHQAVCTGATAFVASIVPSMRAAVEAAEAKGGMSPVASSFWGMVIAELDPPDMPTVRGVARAMGQGGGGGGRHFEGVGGALGQHGGGGGSRDRGRRAGVWAVLWGGTLTSMVFRR